MHLKCFVQSGCYHCQGITCLLRIMFFLYHILRWILGWHGQDDLIGVLFSPCKLCCFESCFDMISSMWCCILVGVSFALCKLCCFESYSVMILSRWFFILSKVSFALVNYVASNHARIWSDQGDFGVSFAPCKLCCFESY